MEYTVSIAKEKIDNLNLDVSLASANLQLVKQIPVTDVNDVLCCLLLSNTAKKLYNSALYLFKKQYKENQTTLNYETLDKLIKNEELHPNFAKLYQDLTAKVSQQVLKLFSQNIKSFFALKQSEKLTEEQKKKTNLPRYYTKNGLAPVYYTNQALSKKSFNEEGVIHFAGTDLKIKLDLTSEITRFSQINQVRLIPSTKNSKDTKLSDLLEKYSAGDIEQPLFIIEIVYTAPLTEQRVKNQSLNLRYETKIIKKVSKRTQKVYEIKKQELVEVNYDNEFLQSVAGIDQNLDQLAIGVVRSSSGATTSSPTVTSSTSFTYNIKYLKSVNQYWNKQKAKLQEEISKQEKLLEELALQDEKIIDSSKSELTEAINNKQILIKKLKNKIKKITTKRNHKIDNYIHQLSRKLINHLSKLGVKNIIYGKNVNFKKEINLGKVTNQNFVNIPFNLIIERLRYKACLAGINFMTVEESYTSKTSFLDREKLHSYKGCKPKKDYTFLGKRFTRSLFRSKDGNVIHADINASFNIIRKVTGDNIYDFINIGAIKVSSPKRWRINLQ